MTDIMTISVTPLSDALGADLGRELDGETAAAIKPALQGRGTTD